jgi:DNA mismatch repair protein MutH
MILEKTCKKKVEISSTVGLKGWKRVKGLKGISLQSLPSLSSLPSLRLTFLAPEVGSEALLWQFSHAELLFLRALWICLVSLMHTLNMIFYQDQR